MAKRQIIEIDRDKCDGCGLCTDACAEGALVLDEENKAVLAKEIFCDGLGACLDVCPVGALTIIEREGDEYSPDAAYEHVLKTRGKEAAQQVHGIPISSCDSPISGGCPGLAAQEISRSSQESPNQQVSGHSELAQWPVQLHLVSPFAPYFNGCELLIAADCTAFSMGSFHQEFLKGKKLIIACPKLDDTSNYIQKLADLLKNNTIKSLTLVIMQVPCCSGLAHIVQRAIEISGKTLDINKIVIDIKGNILP